MGYKAYCYGFLTMAEVEVSDVGTIGILLVFDHMLFYIFDLGSTFLFVSSAFIDGLDLHFDLLDRNIRVSTLVGDFVID